MEQASIPRASRHATLARARFLQAPAVMSDHDSKTNPLSDPLRPTPDVWKTTPMASQGPLGHGAKQPPSPTSTPKWNQTTVTMTNPAAASPGPATPDPSEGEETYQSKPTIAHAEEGTAWNTRGHEREAWLLALRGKPHSEVVKELAPRIPNDCMHEID